MSVQTLLQSYSISYNRRQSVAIAVKLTAITGNHVKSLEIHCEITWIYLSTAVTACNWIHVHSFLISCNHTQSVAIALKSLHPLALIFNQSQSHTINCHNSGITCNHSEIIGITRNPLFNQIKSPDITQNSLEITWNYCIYLHLLVFIYHQLQSFYITLQSFEITWNHLKSVNIQLKSVSVIRNQLQSLCNH